MKLESLVITRSYDSQRSYTARVKFENEYGSAELKLTPDLTERIIAVVGESLIDAAKETALQLTSATIETVTKVEVAQLEARREDPDVL